MKLNKKFVRTCTAAIIIFCTGAMLIGGNYMSKMSLIGFTGYILCAAGMLTVISSFIIHTLN